MLIFCLQIVRVKNGLTVVKLSIQKEPDLGAVIEESNVRILCFYFKSNLRHTHGITPKCVTSGGVHLRGLAPGQHSSEKTSQRWRAVDDTASNLIGPGIEP